MILLLKTDSPTCEVTLQSGGESETFTWEAHRELAKGLLGYLEECLAKKSATWSDLAGIVVFRGPGSFTGLRIGITVVNTIAYAEDIPVVGELGDGWQQKGLARLASGDNDRIVLPEYGREARITKPRK